MASTTDDKRLTAVESAKQDAIKNANKTYDSMINGSDAKYNELIQASKDYATKQQQIQQANTDFAIEKIEQQKDQAKKDYTKEQTGAYTDYQKATDQYGVGAEQQASAGLQNTGYAESSKVQAFTAYQNRYMTARETYNQAVLSYDNAIKDAQLQNNAQLAEIAYKALQMQLEYALEGFQYKNELLQTKLNTQIQLDSEYHDRYQDVLSQINTENALAEQIRQFNANLAEEQRQYNATMAYQKERAAVADSQWEKEYALAKSSASSSGSSSSGSSSKSVTSGGSKTYSSKSSSSSSKKKTSSTKTVTSGGTKKYNTNQLLDDANAKNKKSSTSGWTSAAKMANSLGLPAAVNLDNILSKYEYDKKLVNGIAYYKKK